MSLSAWSRARRASSRLLPAISDQSDDVIIVKILYENASMPELPVRADGEADARAETRITVAIVDDHAMFAEGLARILKQECDLEFVGSASNVAEALALVEDQRPQIVLMDFHLPDGDGAEATEKILRRWPLTKILMLSGIGRNDLLARAIEAGCSGFLAKTRPTHEAVAAIRAASRGETVLRSDALAGLLDRLHGKATGELLTARELGVLRILAKGCSNGAIASELFLSIHTVRNHVSNVLMKLGAHSKLEAVAIATRDGIIRLDEIG
jgi:DNA-binding NarL/FixJ family response regulator